MPYFTVKLMKDGLPTLVELGQNFDSAAGTDRLVGEILMAFSEAGGLPRSSAGWTHMAVHEGFVGGKGNVQPEKPPVLNLSKEEVGKFEQKFHISIS